MSNYEWHFFYKWFWEILPFYVGHFALSKIIEWNFVWVSMKTIIFAKYMYIACNVAVKKKKPSTEYKELFFFNSLIVLLLSKKKKHPQNTKSYSFLNSLIVLLRVDKEMGGYSLLRRCSLVSDGLADHSVVSRSLFGHVHCLIYTIFCHLLDCLSLPPHDLEYRIHIFPHGKFYYNFYLLHVLMLHYFLTTIK